jgi:GxxExxY protein
MDSKDDFLPRIFADLRGSNMKTRTSDMAHADEDGLKHADLTSAILRAFFDVYNELGHGFLESVYENALTLVLKERGFRVDNQLPVPVWYRGTKVGEFRADMLIEGKVFLEIKAVRSIDRAHEAQLMNYLRATHVEIGFVLNFGLEAQFKRMAFHNSRKAHYPPS